MTPPPPPRPPHAPSSACPTSAGPRASRALAPAELARLRAALRSNASAEDSESPERGLHPRGRPAPPNRARLALFATIFTLSWHGAALPSLSTDIPTPFPTAAVVPPREGGPPFERTRKMNPSIRTTQRSATPTILAATIAGALASAATAQNSGFASFTQPSDTIRILGNTVFQGTDWTYEMRIRIGSDARNLIRGHILSEQRDSVEDKTVFAFNGELSKVTIRGLNCGDDASTPLTTTLQDRWLHLAWVRNGSTTTLFVDGIAAQDWDDRPTCTNDYPGSWMSLGMFRYGAGQFPGGSVPSFLGDLDWIRVTDGALYSADFTAPYECEVEASTATRLLLKFNEPNGTAILVDESPNAFVCEVGVPLSPGVKSTSPTLGNTDGGFPACRPTCPADIDENGLVDGVDLAIVLSRWGTLPTDYPRADTNGDGTVDGSDLAVLLSGWGACP